MMPQNPLAQYLPQQAPAPNAKPKNPLAEFLPQPAPGMVERGMDFVTGLGNATDQGWSLGGADELGSAIQAAARRATNAVTGGPDTSFGDLYDARLHQKQGDLRDFRKAHPVASIVGEIAGAAPTAALGAGIAGMSKLPTLAKALLGGTAGGGTYGALSGNPGDRTDSAVMGAALGAGLGAGGVGISKAIAGRTAKRAGDETITGAASADDLRQAARAQYEIADQAEGTIPEQVYRPFVSALTKRLNSEGTDALLHPKMSRVVDLMTENATTPPSLAELQILRRQLGSVSKSAEPDERRLAGIATEALDTFVEKGAGDLGVALGEGRALWARLRKSEILDDAIEAATTRAAGTEAGLRNEFSKLARNKKLMRGFSAEEQAAIKAVSAGTPTRNALRILGGLSLGEGQRRNILSALAGGGLGVMAAGPGAGMIGMVAPAVVGGVAQKMAEKGTMRAAKLARAITSGPKPTQAAPTAMTPPPGPGPGVPMLPGPGVPRLPAPGRPALDVFLEQGAQRRLR